MKLVQFILIVALVALTSPEIFVRVVRMVPIGRRNSLNPRAISLESSSNTAMATERPTFDKCTNGKGPCPNKDKMCEIICKNNPSEGGKVCNCDTYALRGTARNFAGCNRLP